MGRVGKDGLSVPFTLRCVVPLSQLLAWSACPLLSVRLQRGLWPSLDSFLGTLVCRAAPPGRSWEVTDAEAGLPGARLAGSVVGGREGVGPSSR